MRSWSAGSQDNALQPIDNDNDNIYPDAKAMGIAASAKIIKNAAAVIIKLK